MIRSSVSTVRDRVHADGGLARQHDGVDAELYRVRGVGDFGARGAQLGSHRFEHLRGHDHRDALGAGAANDRLSAANGTCSSGISSPRSPRATMTPSLASTISSSRFERRGPLELRHHGARAAALESRRPPAPGADRRRTARSSSPMRSMPSPTPNTRSSTSFGVMRAVGQFHAGRADAFAFAERAAVDDPGPNLMPVAQRAPRAGFGRHPAAAGHPAARFVREMGVRSGQPVGVTREVARREKELVPGAEGDRLRRLREDPCAASVRRDRP